MELSLAASAQTPPSAELVSAEAYVSGNVGSGSLREMVEWVE